jgi:hypothetical protein
MTRLLQKDAPWCFDTHCKSTFNMLKLAFTTAPILSHWIPDMPQIIETDASDYAIAAIHSIWTPDGELHPVAFHSRTLRPTKCNYDMHNKELLAIFKAFKIWRHHLEGYTSPVEVFTDHKNLEYFSTSKTLTRQQARWSEYLKAFNLSLHFQPGKLDAKPDVLTRRWDVYLKEGGVTYADANPGNTHPLFSADQIHAPPTPSRLPAEAVLRTDTLSPSTLPTSAPPARVALLDMETLRSDILTGLATDTDVQAHHETLRQTPCPDSKWLLSPTGFLLHEGAVYVPTGRDLRIRILKACHDHLLAGHLGQTKTLELLRRDYYWPKMHNNVIAFVKLCITCRRTKAH